MDAGHVCVQQIALLSVTEQQLIDKVKGTYAVPVNFEYKFENMVQRQINSLDRLADQQRNVPLALHRILLRGPYSFFSMKQQLNTADNFERLLIKYAMPARIWRSDMHTFVELLRHRLCEYTNFMLSFTYAAYYGVALLTAIVHSSTDPWIECLHSLARSHMVVRDADQPRFGTVSDVAKTWYNDCDGSQLRWLNDRFSKRSTLSAKSRDTTHNAALLHWLLHIVSVMISNIPCFVSNLNGPCQAVGALLLFVNPTYALNFAHSQANQEIKDTHTPIQTILLWLLCTTIAVIIPIFGLKIGGNNVVTISSITAFMTALGMSANHDQVFPNLWGVLCTGSSIGSSILLGRKTRSRTNSTLFAFFRYIVPAAIFWQLLSGARLAEQQRHLDLSLSIPCISVFGAVGFNALVNEKLRELQEYLSCVWEKILNYLELERIRQHEMV